MDHYDYKNISLLDPVLSKINPFYILTPD